jgi:formylglycine-generating enzyme required for sulfatase activity
MGDTTELVRGLDRVVRGGCWDREAERCRAARREGSSPGDLRGYMGLRLSLVPAE